MASSITTEELINTLLKHSSLRKTRALSAKSIVSAVYSGVRATPLIKKFKCQIKSLLRKGDLVQYFPTEERTTYRICNEEPGSSLLLLADGTNIDKEDIASEFGKFIESKNMTRICAMFAAALGQRSGICDASGVITRSVLTTSPLSLFVSVILLLMDTSSFYTGASSKKRGEIIDNAVALFGTITSAMMNVTRDEDKIKKIVKDCTDQFRTIMQLIPTGDTESIRKLVLYVESDFVQAYRTNPRLAISLSKTEREARSHSLLTGDEILIPEPQDTPNQFEMLLRYLTSDNLSAFPGENNRDAYVTRIIHTSSALMAYAERCPDGTISAFGLSRSKHTPRQSNADQSCDVLECTIILIIHAVYCGVDADCIIRPNMKQEGKSVSFLKCSFEQQTGKRRMIPTLSHRYVTLLRKWIRDNPEKIIALIAVLKEVSSVKCGSENAIFEGELNSSDTVRDVESIIGSAEVRPDIEVIEALTNHMLDIFSVHETSLNRLLQYPLGKEAHKYISRVRSIFGRLVKQLSCESDSDSGYSNRIIEMEFYVDGSSGTSLAPQDELNEVFTQVSDVYSQVTRIAKLNEDSIMRATRYLHVAAHDLRLAFLASARR